MTRLMRMLVFSLVISPRMLAGADKPEALDPARLRERVLRVAEQVAALAGEGDLIDTLHFGWFDQPYARATLAVAVKTTAVLRRELYLREFGNGAIPDTTVLGMLAWTDEALERVSASRPLDAFRPHRLRATADALTAGSADFPIYTFVDRATSTRCCRQLGDFDLLASMGFRAYAAVHDNLLGERAPHFLTERAEALGLAVIAVPAHLPGPGNTGSSARAEVRGSGGDATSCAVGDGVLALQPGKLRSMLEATRTSPRGPRRTSALVDSVAGESLAASLARRALARGLSGRRRFAVDGWNAPGAGAPPEQRAVAAAMWIHAIYGQSVGLLRGWRDLRDGSGSPYPSVLLDPAYLEKVAHTALDLIRLRAFIDRFQRAPLLAIVVGPDAADPHDDNAWAAWVEPVWSELLRRQIHFDVVSPVAVDDEVRSRYPAVFPLTRGDTLDITSLMLRIERTLVAESKHVRRVTARELDGGLAADVYVQGAQTPAGRPCVVLVNLSGTPRRLRLRGGPELGICRDVVSNVPVHAPSELVPLDPWQVRLLWPADSASSGSETWSY